MKLHGMIPDSAVRHEARDTSSLIFKEGTREYHLRGAVCWPVMVSGQYMGAALVGGLDVVKNRVVVVAEMTFASIETIMDHERGIITAAGVGQWFNQVWTTFYCHRFFVEDGAAGQHDRYAVEVRASSNIQPQPRFKLVAPMVSYYPVIQQYLNAKRLIYPKDGLVHQLIMQTIAVGPDQATTHPVIRALGVMLAGFMAFPWRNGDVPFVHEAFG
jgi:hypothetical protein